MFLYSRTARSALQLTAANLTIRGVSMLFQVYLTEQIGAAGIGLLQLILTVNGFAFTVGTSGLRVAAMYLSAEEFGFRRRQGIRHAMLLCMRSGLLLSILTGGLLVVLAKPLSYFWIRDLQAIPSLRLLGLTLPITCLSAILAGYFTACGKIRRLVMVEIADRILSVLLTAGFLAHGVSGDLSHACFSIAGGSALAGVFSVLLLFSMMMWDFRSCEKTQPSSDMRLRLRRLCLPIALNDYLRSGLGTLEQFLIPYGLSRCGGSRTQAMADYGTIQGMVFPLMMLPATLLFSVADLLVSKLARCRAEQNRHGMQNLISGSLRVSWVFACSTAGLFYVLAAPLGELIYDSVTAGRYLRLFAPLLPVLYLDYIVDGMHKGLGQQVYCVRVNTLTNLLDVIGLLLFLPVYGIGGYYLTYSVTHILNFLLSLRRLLQIGQFTVSLRFLFQSLLIVILSALLSVWIVSTPFRWMDVIVCAVVYGAVLWLLLTLTGTIDRVMRND